jgi:transposase
MDQLSYSERITESLAELLALERKAPRAIIRDRLRFLRLLKSGAAATLPEAGGAVGIKKSWRYELWKRYKEKGLSALSHYPFKGTKPLLDAEQQRRFKDSLATNGTATLAQAAALIEEQTRVSYSLSGTWYVLRRMGIKKKTGRPSATRKDEQAVEAFKKSPFADSVLRQALLLCRRDALRYPQPMQKKVPGKR